MQRRRSRQSLSSSNGCRRFASGRSPGYSSGSSACLAKAMFELAAPSSDSSRVAILTKIGLLKVHHRLSPPFLFHMAHASGESFRFHEDAEVQPQRREIPSTPPPDRSKKDPSHAGFPRHLRQAPSHHLIATAWFSFSLTNSRCRSCPCCWKARRSSSLARFFRPHRPIPAARAMMRFLSRATLPGHLHQRGHGPGLPMCECGRGPVIRRLIGKGLPVSNAWPICWPPHPQPIARSTYAAFRGPGMEMTVLGWEGYFVAVIVLSVHKLPIKESCARASSPRRRPRILIPSGGILTRLSLALRVRLRLPRCDDLLHLWASPSPRFSARR